MYKVVEKFISLDGEGPTAGELAVFIRFFGCNLNCSWCDTKYSFDKNGDVELLSCENILYYITKSKAENVTITGGEPLLVENISKFFDMISLYKELKIHVETNGSVNVEAFRRDNVRFVLDYKLPSSGMEEFMCKDNLINVQNCDVYKFVIANEIDLFRAYEIIDEYSLTQKCAVYLSPVLSLISPEILASFIKEKSLTGVKLQLQLHKIIWGDAIRGV